MALPEKKKYTYQDIERYPDNEKWEILNGVPYMQARPTPAHQLALMKIGMQIGAFLKDKPCDVFPETEVFLDTKFKEQKTSSSEYIVPDLVIVCDKSKIQDDAIYGVPDLVIEILSPSTSSNDFVKKMDMYMMAGIKEYWIVSVKNKEIQLFSLSGTVYDEPVSYKDVDILESVAFEGLKIKLEDIF